MHRTTRLPRHRVCHEGCIDTVLFGDRANDAFEQEDLIGKFLINSVNKESK